MREAAEAADDVGVQSCPFQQIGMVQRTHQGEAALLVGKVFRVLEREIEEQPLPRRNALVETLRDRTVGHGARERIGGEGALALTIVLDQFPRNMFRGDARTYAADPLARATANIALKRGYDQDVPDELRGFFFLPFMHSEELVDQERCVQLYREAGSGDLKYAAEHRDIIRRFGRFPHRNAMLGRETTAEEQAFLDGGGFKG